MKFTTLLPLVALLFCAGIRCGPALAADDSCSPIDLADPNPAIPVEQRPLSTMPILQQGNTETCYAHVAAELVDAWRFSHGDTDYSHLTDPLSLATSGKRSDNVDETMKGPQGCVPKPKPGDKGNLAASYDFGRLGFAYNAAKTNGSCSRSVIMDLLTQKDQTNAVKNHFLKLKELVARYEQLEKLRSDQANMKKDLASMEWEPLHQGVLGEACAFMRDQYGIKPSQLPDTGWIESVLSQENPLVVLDEMLHQACKESGKVKQVALPDLKVSSTSDFASIGAKDDVEAAQKFISSALNGSVFEPVALNLCAEIFDNPNYNHPRNVASPCTPPPPCATHSVLLAGRKRNPATGKCQLIVRSTWGDKACSQKNKWGCLHGDFLIDEDVVYRNTFDVISFGEGRH